MTAELKGLITEWLTGSDTCYLLGAGCSVCAGKPMIGELTDRVLQGADENLIAHFGNLRPVSDRPATVEELISYLLRYRGILGAIKDAQNHQVSAGDIDQWIDYLKGDIVCQIADDWLSSLHHGRFLQRIQGDQRHGPRDIFCLNYDTLLEATLDDLCIPYEDGFRGNNRAWFDPTTYETSLGRTVFRLFKLHGSINWKRDGKGLVRRYSSDSKDTAEEPVVVYPSEQKHLQTQYGVYETLISKFRERLRASRANNCLVVIGYSYNDEHINEAICDAVVSAGSNLTVISFVGSEQNSEEQKSRFERLEKRCDGRFNVFIGDQDSGSFIGRALDEDVANTVLDAQLWRFENLVGFLTGVGW